MTANAGSIKYTVEAETGDLLTAEKIVDKTTNSMVQDFNKIDKSAMKIKKSASGVKTAMGGMGRKFGMAGAQVSQFTGQLQGGTNGLLALSQQSTDIGFAFGGMGIAIGAAVSLISGLALAVTGSSDAVDDLNDKLVELAKNSRLTKEQAAVLNATQQESILTSTKTIVSTQEEITLLEKKIKVHEDLIASTDEWAKEALENGRTQDDVMARVWERTRGVSDTIKELTGELNKQKAVQQQANIEIEKSSAQMALNNSLIGEGKGLTKEQSDEVKTLTKSLEGQIVALEDGEKAAFEYATAQQLGLKVGEQIPANIQAQIDKVFELRDAQKQVALDKAAMDKKNAADASAKSKLTSSVQGLGLSDEDVIKQKLATELELLRQAEEQKIEIEGSYQERRVELKRQAEEQIAGLNEKTTKEASANFEALENQIIGTFASVASGAQDGSDAIRSLAQSILTQMIGALIKMGIQSILGQTASTAATVASMAAITVAATPAATMVSLATAGANAGLASAGIASTAAVASAAALPGREFGGGVSAGNMYRMGESGPEILTQGNDSYVVPSKNGSVTKNSDIGGNMSVVVNNNAPGVDVEAVQSSDGKTVEIAVKKAVAEMTNQINNNQGNFARSLRTKTNVQMKANR